MTSTSSKACVRRGRALLVALGLAALASIALAAVWIHSRGDSRAAQPGAARAPREIDRAQAPATDPGSSPRDGESESVRAVMGTAASQAPLQPQDPILIGRVLDESGAALVDAVARVELAGDRGQRLAATVDASGAFGPLTLMPGSWQVTASASGRHGAMRTLELAADDLPATIELRLARLASLEVLLAATGPGTDGDPVRDLSWISSLLSLHLSVDGETAVERRLVEPRAPVCFEPPPERGARIELWLGSERVLQRELPSAAGKIVLQVDPLDLRSRLVELEIRMRAPDGRPLSDATQALLAWEGGAHLVAGQPGLDPSCARFEVCPPGAARLSVIDANGREAQVDVFVPFEGPAVLDVELELVAPMRR